MVKRKKTGGRDFPKGVSGNPKGRPPMSTELKAARNLTNEEFGIAMSKLLLLPYEDLKKLSENPRTPTIEALITRILIVGVQTGAPSHLNYFVERLWGKVPDKHHISGSLNSGLVGIISEVRKTKKDLNGSGEGNSKG